MDRVLNKDFASESYLNSALTSFSDVFHPAFCMQSCHVRDVKRVKQNLFCTVFSSCMLHLPPAPENR